MAAGYFSLRTRIQIYLAIKIFPRHQDNSVALLALLYLHNNPNPTIPVIVIWNSTSTQSYLQNTANVSADAITGVGIGTAVSCDGANIPEYHLDIPTNLLFEGVSEGVPTGVPANFSVDLFRLQNVILRSI